MGLEKYKLENMIRDVEVHGNVPETDRLLSILGSFSSIEEAIKDERAPEWCFLYAFQVIRDRWEDGELIISTSPKYSFKYSCLLAGCKRRWPSWPMGEAAILTSSYWSVMYARHIFKARWLKAEPIIYTCPEDSDLYDVHVRGIKRKQEGIKMNNWSEKTEAEKEVKIYDTILSTIEDMEKEKDVSGLADECRRLLKQLHEAGSLIPHTTG